jgi:hypothetical protein
MSALYAEYMFERGPDGDFETGVVEIIGIVGQHAVVQRTRLDRMQREKVPHAAPLVVPLRLLNGLWIDHSTSATMRLPNE